MNPGSVIGGYSDDGEDADIKKAMPP